MSQTINQGLHKIPPPPHEDLGGVSVGDARRSFSLKAANFLVRGSPGSLSGRVKEDERIAVPGAGPSASRARLGILSPVD